MDYACKTLPIKSVRILCVPDFPAVLEGVVEGEAADIISGDQLLLRLGAYQGIPLLTPRAFLEALQRQTKPSGMKA